MRVRGTTPRPWGLWLHGATEESAQPAGADRRPLPFRCVPEHPSLIRLLVGGPGERLPTPGVVAGFVDSLPPATRARLAVTVLGPEPGADVALAQRLADALGEPVRARHGVVVGDADLSVTTTAVDAGGRLTWRPFARLSRYDPGRCGAVVERWRAPVPGLVPTDPGTYRLTSEWSIDVVPAGLVLRPSREPRDPAQAAPPTHPDRVDLVIEARDARTFPDDMLSAVSRLADALPGPARSRLRVVLTAPVSAGVAAAVRAAVPAPQQVRTGGAVPFPAPIAGPGPTPARTTVPVPRFQQLTGPALASRAV